MPSKKGNGAGGREVVEVNYTFTGKLALFPLTILFLATGAGSLLLFGNKPYSGGYFNSEELYYGIAGVALSIVCILLIVFLFAWLVIKISFVFDLKRNAFAIHKKGVFRSSKLEFVLSDSTIHYFRTHFSAEQCWLAFVVKEDHKFYKVFSWRGRGNQRDRFLRLFYHLQDEMIQCQSYQQHMANYHAATGLGSPRADRSSLLMVQSGLMYWNRQSTEIISKEEFVLIGPFTQRLKKLVALQPSEPNSPSLSEPDSFAAGRGSMRLSAPSSKKSKKHKDKEKDKARTKGRLGSSHFQRPLCIEDLTIINFDAFFQHFKQRKLANTTSHHSESKEV